METLEAILIAVLFFIPGVIITRIGDRLYPKTKEESTDFKKTVYYVYVSTIILFINIFSIKILINKMNFCFLGENYEIKIETLSELQDQLSNINFLLFYLVLTLITSFIFVIVNEKIIKKISLKTINEFRKRNGKVEETEFCTVWDEIFENEDIDLNNVFIEIKKDNDTIAQGVLKSYSPPNFQNKELLLVYTKEVEEILKEDQSREEKLFDEIDMQYYHFGTGVLIKFYDMTKYNNCEKETT